MDHYCVVGNPIEHSLSPFIHNYFAKNTSQNLEYGRQLIELDKFKETVVGLFKDGLCGCNVTVPFKEQAYDMCDKLTPRAELAQSVNTLMMCDGIIYGDNTDGAGIVKDLMDNQNVVIKDRDILVIGAGGAAKGIMGGRGSMMGGMTSIQTRWTQTNKETRIQTNSGMVKSHVLFKDESLYPKDREYRDAMLQLTTYSMMGKNKHDDVPDVLADLAD